MKAFNDYCKEMIMDELRDRKGETHYACDLGLGITEYANYDGTLTYSTAEAKEYIREWWDEASDYWEYEKFNFGENFHNPFDNPEAYMVCMVIEGVQSILAQTEVINSAWNDEIELTEDVINKIIEEIADLEVKW